MLPKDNRLSRKKDFERIAKNSRIARGQFLVLKFVPNGMDVSRFGFIVSKKVSNKAVVRNKVKRRLREAVKDILPSIKKGYDIAIFAQKAIIEKNFEEISRDVEGALLKANNLYEKADN